MTAPTTASVEIRNKEINTSTNTCVGIENAYLVSLGELDDLRIGMLKTAVRLSAMLILIGSPCVSQFEIRSVTGVVTDKNGRALEDAAVQLENTYTLLIMSYMTDKDGRFHFNQLDDDIDYILKAKYRSYSSKPKTLSKFNSSRHPEVNLVIPFDCRASCTHDSMKMDP